jgi:hypothetical protein
VTFIAYISGKKYDINTSIFIRLLVKSVVCSSEGPSTLNISPSEWKIVDNGKDIQEYTLGRAAGRVRISWR